MSSRHLWAGGVVLGLALGSVACDVKVGEGGGGLSVDFAAGKASDEWVRTYDIKPGGRLELININGQIHASPATGSQVEVRALREVRTGSEEASRELLEKMAEAGTIDRADLSRLVFTDSPEEAMRVIDEQATKAFGLKARVPRKRHAWLGERA